MAAVTTRAILYERIGPDLSSDAVLRVPLGEHGAEVEAGRSQHSCHLCHTLNCAAAITVVKDVPGEQEVKRGRGERQLHESRDHKADVEAGRPGRGGDLPHPRGACIETADLEPLRRQLEDVPAEPRPYVEHTPGSAQSEQWDCRQNLRLRPSPGRLLAGGCELTPRSVPRKMCRRQARSDRVRVLGHEVIVVTALPGRAVAARSR